MRNALITLSLATTLLAAGCSASGEPPAGSPSTPAGTAATASPAAPTSTEPADPPTSASAEPSASASPTEEAEPVGACLGGRFVLVRFSGRGLGSTDLTATGKDLTAIFADGQYTMKASGKSPYSLTDGKDKATLTMKGTMSGRFTAGKQVRYSVTSAEGSAALTADGQTRRTTMTQLSKTLAPQGTVPTRCSGDTLTISMKTTTLEFERA